jgi:hypothetical protein
MATLNKMKRLVALMSCQLITSNALLKSPTEKQVKLFCLRDDLAGILVR